MKVFLVYYIYCEKQKQDKKLENVKKFFKKYNHQLQKTKRQQSYKRKNYMNSIKEQR